jgi:hypothetical protein
MSGATVSSIPVQVALVGTAAFVPMPSPPSYLYPAVSGYSVAAGQCTSEATVPSTLATVPGGSASAIVPLGLLPLRLTNSNGASVTGATVTLTDTTCGASGSIYNMPLTDATGTTMTSVPYGTYSYSVTEGGVTVAPTNLTLTVGGPYPIGGIVSSVGPGQVAVTNSTTKVSTITYLPAVVQVPA